MKKVTLSFVSMIVMIVLFPLHATAEQVDSLCIHFVGIGGKRHIELSKDGYSLSGALPFTLCELQTNETYRLRVEGDKLESRVGKLTIAQDGKAEVKGILRGVFLRNALLPGLGTYYSERRTEAMIDAIGLYSSLYKFIEEEKQYHHLHNRYDVLLQQYAEAKTQARAELINYYLHKASIELNVQNKSRRRFAILSAGLYAEQLLVPLVLSRSPRAEIKSDGRLVRFHGGGKSRTKAVLLSMVHPGRGQFYEGKVKRGILFSFMTSISTIVALDFHSQYDWAAYRYDMVVEAFNAASNIYEKERLKDEAERLWDEVEKSKTKRDGAYIALAAIWGLSVFDSFFMTDDAEETEFPVSYEINGSGAFLVLRF